VEIATRAGLGTTFRLELPLSAAIQTVLLAQTAVQLVAFPERMITEALAFRREDVQIVNGQRSILLHGRYLPIFRLVDLLKLPAEEAGTARETMGTEMAIIVCEWGGRRIGIEVFKILRRHEMLIREMPPRIASIPGIGGISTLGTDRIVIVVAPDAVFDLARRATVFGLRVADSRVAQG
ncbi:MAG: chemotaxis protein CheW, partial [Vicinamibacteria bacterium]|nr:chemotaxis protein CheW [Vicinamibacteria bacterium]